MIRASPRARRSAGTAICVLLAAAAALANVGGAGPLRLGSGSADLQVAGASTLASVDPPPRQPAATVSQLDDLGSLTKHAVLLSELITTPPVLAEIARAAHIGRNLLTGSTSYVSDLPESMLRPDLEVRANQIVTTRAPFQVYVEPDPNIPRLSIYTRAPASAQALELADAVVPALNTYLAAQPAAAHVPPMAELHVQQLGAARGADLGRRAKPEILVLTFVIVLLGSLGLLVFTGRVRAGWRMAAARPARSVRTRDAIGSVAARRTPAMVAQRADAWPHTTRLSPWLIALFLLILWLLPFDAIQIGSSLPVELKLDRLLLPLVVLTSLLALAGGGRVAPRFRLSWVHAGVLAFTALTCLTLVVNAHQLGHSLQLDTAVKRLTLVLSYVAFFLIVAGGIRRSEVSSFLMYTLALAVVAAIGTLIEYRLNYNIFYDAAHHLLPGFKVGTANSTGIDDVGRRVVEGPAGVPLEAVGMFTLALPVAVVGLITAVRWRPRMLYGLAAALLLAASISTERKSGLLGPVAVLLTIAYFRRAQVLRLAPLAVVLLLVVKLAAPGALGGVTGQIAPSRLGVSTVDVRIVRFDAVRADVWSHLALGQGFGTYYPVRVLDNELLGRLVEGGVLGLIAYGLMLLSIVGVALGPIRRNEPGPTSIGLVAAAGAIGALVLSVLYDFIGFPHGPYILFSIAGLLVAVVKAPERTGSDTHRAAERPWNS